MRVLVLEAVCAGLVHEQPGSSPLLPEGCAMLIALLEDLAAIEPVSVQTVVHGDVLRDIPPLPRVDVYDGWTPAGSRECFRRLLADAELVLIIAPETGGLLQKLVEEASARSGNCTPDAIALCTDKLALAAHLTSHAVSTIPTKEVDWSTAFSDDLPRVIKPRDGAGCELTYLVRGPGDWRNAQQAFREVQRSAIVQPYCPGRALSVGVIYSSTGFTVLPIARQQITTGGAFGRVLSYCGGSVPVLLDAAEVTAIHDLVRRASVVIPGLLGYVGFDILLPHNDAECPLLVEINPRLTTSYIGYRRLCEQNLAAAMLGIVDGPLTWRDQVVEFDASGAEISSRSTAG